MTRSAIAEKIAAVPDLKPEKVSVPDWGVTVEIKGMNGHERSDYLGSLAEAIRARDEDHDNGPMARLEMELIAFCVYDPETGQPAFTEDDVDMLLGKSGAVIGFLSTKCLKASGLDAKAEERLGKGSLALVPTTGPAPVTPKGASTSTSPSNSEG